MLFPLARNQKLEPLDLDHQSESTFRGPIRVIQPLGKTQVRKILSSEILTHYKKEEKDFKAGLISSPSLLISHVKERLYLMH